MVAPDKVRRQEDARERQDRRATLTPAEQLEILEGRPGNSAREKARLTP